MAVFSSPRGVLSTLFAVTFFLQAAIASHGIKHVERNPEAMAAHLDETRQLLQARADNVAITGVQGSVATRREIRDLATDSDAWNLYLLGLERFKSKSQSDPLSYYQIAGVHGVPYVSWNNYALKHTAGYCPHAQTLFGSWHRPYLGVYEQAWYACVQEVVNEFPQSERDCRWGPAAETLRMPFWDWAKAPASGDCTVPSLITDQKVTVTKPNQGQVQIDNPLYQYSWGNSLPQEIGSGPNRNNPFTLRHPQAGNPYTSNNAEFCSDVNNNRISIRDRVYGIFSSRAATGDVTSEQVGVRTTQNGNSADSFESVHDLIHVLTGGGAANGNDGGHMWYLDWSSFDPVFWLHHTNIDRLISMYQVMDTNGQVNNNGWVTRGRFNQDRAQYNNGDQVDGSSPLWPFRKSTGDDYYTSDELRATNVLGYVYPETGQGSNAQSVGQTVNDLYGPNANNNPARPVASPVSRSCSSRVSSSSASTGVSSATSSSVSSASSGISSAISSAASSGVSSAASSGASSSASNRASAASSAASSSNGSSGSSTVGGSSAASSAASSTPVSSNGSKPSSSAGSSSGGSGVSTGFPGSSSIPTSGRGGSSATQSSSRSQPTGGNGGNGNNGGSGGSGGQYSGRPFEDGDYHTICSVTANKYAVDGSYIINFFLGGKKSSGNSTNSTGSFPFKNSTSSGGSYSSRDGFIGSFAVLGMSQRSNSSITPVEIQASIPLTTALQGKQASGELKSLGPDDVTDYLKQHFSYIIVGKGGEIDPLSISGLHFGVSTAKVTPPKSSSELPSFGKYIDLPKVTEDFPCGAPYTPNPSVPYNPTPANPSGGSSSSKPTGAFPSQFPSYGGGQCQTQKTIVYVDENGKFLYQEVGSSK